MSDRKNTRLHFEFDQEYRKKIFDGDLSYYNCEVYRPVVLKKATELTQNSNISLVSGEIFPDQTKQDFNPLTNTPQAKVITDELEVEYVYNLLIDRYLRINIDDGSTIFLYDTRTGQVFRLFAFKGVADF